MLTGETWRVGRSQGHNVYQGDVHRLVVLGEPAAAASLAGEVVEALNAADLRAVARTVYAPVASALLAVERIRELHVPQTEQGLIYGAGQGHDDCEVCQDAGHDQQCCRECTASDDDSTVYVLWPCPTARAVGATS